MDSYRDTSFYETVRRILPELDSCKPGRLVSEKLPLMKTVIFIGQRENTPGMFRFADLINNGRKISRIRNWMTG